MQTPIRTPASQQSAAREFVDFWTGKGYEKGQTQPFWIDLLRVLGVPDPERGTIEFEDHAHIDAAHGFIDGYIPATHVLIEQKSLGKNLRAGIPQSDGSVLTPFQQAKRYAVDLPYSRRPRFIVGFSCGEDDGRAERVERVEIQDAAITAHPTRSTRSTRLKSLFDGDRVSRVPDATLYHFGVLTSNVHMAWMRAVAGRLKSDYRYSVQIVYNNFPWPDGSRRAAERAEPQSQPDGLCDSASSAPLRERIARTVQAILDARAKYPNKGR